MSGLRKRLAEVLAMQSDSDSFEVDCAAADAGWNLLNAPALARALEDAERYRWGVKHARWIRHEHEAYVAIPVALDADLSCEAMRTHAIDAARGK